MKMNNAHEDKVEQVFHEVESSMVSQEFDASKFNLMSRSELASILGLTIKKDDENKVITFLALLSAYTEDSQMNLSFQAPSSTGKSFIPMEVAKLFPEEDVLEVAYCSPTAFFHNHGSFDASKEGYIVNLSRKIVIFLDQPHMLLLQHLRPLLSHDKKEIRTMITDQKQRQGLKTKNVYVQGFPVVVFCTAGLTIDEQESTRFLLLSPETTQEKLREAIKSRVTKESNTESYKSWLDADPARLLLKRRIIAIKSEQIKDVRINSPEKITERFFALRAMLKPRHQRDITRILSLTKVFALLNLWFREREGGTLIAAEEDINSAFELWDGISESQELNIPPFVFQVYKEIILPTWRNVNLEHSLLSDKSEVGLTYQEITKAHMAIYGRPLQVWLLRQQILPILEDVGLITREADVDDRRKMLIFPTVALEKVTRDIVS